MDEMLQQSDCRLTLLNEITRDALGIDDQSQMLSHLAEHMKELMGAEDCYISLWDEDQRRVSWVAGYGPALEKCLQAKISPFSQTLTETVIRTGNMLGVVNISDSPELSPWIAEVFPGRSILVLPLIAGEKKCGAVLVIFAGMHDFAQDEIEVCEQATAQIALAVAKSQLLEIERRRANELDALRATAAEISMELDLSALLVKILERATSLLHATGGDLGLFDEKTRDIQIAVSHNMGRDYTGARMAVGEGAMGRAVALNQPVTVSDYHNWDGRSLQYNDGPWQAVLAVPLHIQGRIIGALGIVDVDQWRSFPPDDERLLELFALQATIVLENAKHYAAEKQHAADLAILFESSTATTRTLDLQTVNETAAEQLTRSVHATSASLLAFEPSSGKAALLAEYFSPQAKPEERVTNLGTVYNLHEFPETLALLRAGKWQTLNISDPHLHPADRAEMTEYGVKSSLNLPMVVSGRVRGYAEIWDSREERAWSDNELKLCQTLANQAAVAIENARLYDEMRMLASTDMLTGIFNRRGLFEHGVREIKRAVRFSRPLSAIMLDIDYFKQINDIHSHAVGDQVLQKLAKLCSRNLREVDILGRYGGEEFAVLLPETGAEAAYQTAQRLLECVAATQFRTAKGPLSITISLGIACTQGDINDLSVLLDHADSAMYAAKRAGRNRVCMAEEIYMTLTGSHTPR